MQLAPIRVPYDWVFSNAVLTALQAGLVITQQFDNDADFEWLDWIANSTGLFSLQVFDSSTGRQLSNLAVNGENATGTAQLPRRLIEPYTVARSSTIKIVFNDRSGSGNTVQFVASGYKLYPQSN